MNSFDTPPMCSPRGRKTLQRKPLWRCPAHLGLRSDGHREACLEGWMRLWRSGELTVWRADGTTVCGPQGHFHFQMGSFPLAEKQYLKATHSQAPLWKIPHLHRDGWQPFHQCEARTVLSRFLNQAEIGVGLPFGRRGGGGVGPAAAGPGRDWGGTPQDVLQRAVLQAVVVLRWEVGLGKRVAAVPRPRPPRVQHRLPWATRNRRYFEPQKMPLP